MLWFFLFLIKIKTVTITSLSTMYLKLPINTYLTVKVNTFPIKILRLCKLHLATKLKVDVKVSLVVTCMLNLFPTSSPGGAVSCRHSWAKGPFENVTPHFNPLLLSVKQRGCGPQFLTLWYNSSVNLQSSTLRADPLPQGHWSFPFLISKNIYMKMEWRLFWGYFGNWKQLDSSL